mgnify:CR=1 FL=1
MWRLTGHDNHNLGCEVSAAITNRRKATLKVDNKSANRKAKLITPDILIETTRLIIRTVTMMDVENVALSGKHYDGPIANQEAENQITWMHNNHQRNTSERLIHLCLAIIDKETQKIIGWCGLDQRNPTQAHPVLFYLLKTDHWGQGLATEAARALLNYAFTKLSQHRIDGRTARENIASKRVMEKIGMQYLGTDDEGHAFMLTREMHTAGYADSQR